MATYEILCDEAFLLEGFIAYRNSKMGRWVRVAIKALCFTLLFALAAFSFLLGPKAYIFAILFIVLALIVTISHKIDLWFMCRRWRKSPFYDDRCRVSLGDTGIRSEGSASKSEVPWASITSAKRAKLGFILFLGPNVYQWLPDRALTSGSIPEVKALLQRSRASKCS